MPVTEPHTNIHGEQSHPAFAVATVTRTHVGGGGKVLFQSDLRHNDVITVGIHTATRARDLGRDWVHPSKSIVEVQMSVAQWGQFVSAIGSGSGVPVTLSRREGFGSVDDIPYEPRTAQAHQEVRAAVGDLLAKVTKDFEALSEAIEQKKGVKAIREALRTLKYSIQNAPANARFAVQSMEEAAEQVVAQSITEIEAAVSRAAASGAPSSAQLGQEHVAALEGSVVGTEREGAQ